PFSKKVQFSHEPVRTSASTVVHLYFHITLNLVAFDPFYFHRALAVLEIDDQLSAIHIMHSRFTPRFLLFTRRKAEKNGMDERLHGGLASFIFPKDLNKRCRSF